MQNPAVLINGEHGNVISSFDRGLLYGDGVFETLAIKNSKAVFWNDHLERLQHGCEVLGLPTQDEKLLEAEVQRLLMTDPISSECVIKIIITRGVGNRGYKPDRDPVCTRIVQKFPWPEHSAKYSEQGINVTQCAFRLSIQSKLAQIKHLNRLEQVLARSEWDEEFQEGLVCDTNENIIEATSNNVFFQLNDVLVTPDLTNCGVAGVMRKKIIEFCQANNLSIQIRDFKLAELDDIQAMLLCNSVNGVWPVSHYCGRKLVKTAIIKQLTAAFNR